MGYKRGPEREQEALLPTRVEDFVGPTHIVRLIDAYAARQDMAELEFKKSRPKDSGRPPYAPDDLLRLYIYGYWNRIRSSRALERECRRNVEVMFLVRQLAFDHKTIANFRKDNGPALQKACAEFVRCMRTAGLLSSADAVVAIDGSKFKANAAPGSTVDEAGAARQRAKLTQQIAEYLEQMDQVDASEAEPPEPSAEQMQAVLMKLLDQDYRLAQAQQHIEAKAQAQQEQADAHAIKPQAGLTDPDAVRLRGGLTGYNVQQAVDAHSKLIVAHEVTQQANDQRSLEPMATAAQAALGAQQLTAVADTGYMNGEQAQRCEQAGISPVVPMQRPASTTGEQFYPKSRFAYDPDSDTYRCPAGELLRRFKRSRAEQKDFYGTRRCATCPLKAQCTPGKRRRIVRSWHAAALERADHRVQADKKWMRMRKSTVEPRFALLKAMMPEGFLVRGLGKVRGEMALAVLTVNLRRAMNFVGIERLIEMMRFKPA